MRTTIIPDADFQDRVKRLQVELARADLDVLITYSSESEAASSRYLADFWPFFDFAGVIVPREGCAGAGHRRAGVVRVRQAVLPHQGHPHSPAVCGKLRARLGAAGDLRGLCVDPENRLRPAAEADRRGRLEHLPAPHLRRPAARRGRGRDRAGRRGAAPHQVHQVAYEIAAIRQAYWITEQAMIEALDSVAEGMAEWEIEAGAHMTMRRLGAEGTSYPIWVCSGPNTHQSLCRSTNRRIKRNELVQLTFGARHMGYCGNMCRPFAIGRMPDRARNLMSVALEGVHGALRDIRPGVSAKVVFDNYYNTLAKYGFEQFTLYGPAHGSGSSEVEGLWLGAGSDLIIQPGMQFNIDIWLNDGEYGLRYEDGIVVTDDGIEELTSYRREIIEL